MIKDITLKTKKNEYNEDVFPFEDIFAVYNKDLSPSATQEALHDWRLFVKGEEDFLSVKSLNTLVLLEDVIEEENPGTYGKLIDYIYQNKIIDSRLLIKLFFKLHPLWNKNKYFDKLLGLKNLIKSIKSENRLIQKWAQYTPFLFETYSPKTTAQYYAKTKFNQWKDAPRSQNIFYSFITIIESYCKLFYEKNLTEIERKNSIFLILLFWELLLQANREMKLNDNFTKDFIFNPTVMKYDKAPQKTVHADYIIKNVFTLFKEDLQKQKKALYPAYTDYLADKYLPQLKGKEFSAEFFSALQNIIKVIYNMYPINYLAAPQKHLPEYDFVKQVIQTIILRAIPQLPLCRKFTKDLRLRTDYPPYDKILGDIIKENDTVWKANNEQLKQQYLQRIYKQYIPTNLKQYIWDRNFLNKLEQIRLQFYKDNFDKTNQQIYFEMLSALMEEILKRAKTSLTLLPCKDFLSDIRLNLPEIKDDIIKNTLSNCKFDKFRILLIYIGKFFKEGYFKNINEYTDSLYNTVIPQYETLFKQGENEAVKKAYFLLNQYNDRHKIFDFFKGKQDDRKEFWNSILDKNTDMDIVPFGNYICMIRVKAVMFLESSVYTYPCYVFEKFFNNQRNFDLIAKSLETIVKRNASNDPELTAKTLSRYQEKEPQKISHNLPWQEKMLKFIK